MRRFADHPALLVIFPIIEIAVLIAIGQVIGPAGRSCSCWRPQRSAAGCCGGRAARAWRAFRADLAEGRPPGNTATEGLLVLVGGIFMLVPGFVSDVIGALLIAPPTRRLARVGVLRADRPADLARRRDVPLRSAQGPGPVRRSRSSRTPEPRRSRPRHRPGRSRARSSTPAEPSAVTGEIGGSGSPVTLRHEKVPPPDGGGTLCVSGRAMRRGRGGRGPLRGAR